MPRKMPVIVAYLALLILTFPVPLLHHYRTDRAIELMRPAIKMADGSYSPMLLPADILLLRWLGELSGVVVVGVLTAFVLSFWQQNFTRPSTLLAIAVGQCAFTTLYAFSSTLLLGRGWLHGAG